MNPFSRTSLLTLSALVLAAGLSAQDAMPAAAPKPPAPKVDFPAASPASTLKQHVGLTDIEVVYSRPGVKGRTVFGGLEPLGKVWRTGANAATKITFSTPVKFGGVDVPAGSYQLFSIPGADEWTVILNKAAGQWGAYSYDEKQDLVRVKTKPVALAQSVETFTIDLNDIRDDSATLTLSWQKTCVPVKLEFAVTASIVAQIEAAMASAGEKKADLYAQAAQFYLDHGLDLNKAVAWSEESLKLDPKAFWTAHQQAQILVKQGKKAEAIAAAQRSLAIAAARGGDDYGFNKKNNDLIASLK